MPSEVVPPKKKLPIVQLAVLAVVAVVVAVLILRGVDVRALMARGIGMIRGLGAPLFFLGMMILPAFGFPLMAFTIPAGEAFAPMMSMPGVIAVSLVAVAINLALGYWVARYAVRPLLAGLIKRYGYSVPRVTKENALTVTLVVRLTPGPPYALQAAVLGMAEVPFKIYMVVSWLGLLPWVVGAIILGQGLLSGRVGLALYGLGVIVVAAVLVHWFRRKYFRKTQL